MINEITKATNPKDETPTKREGSLRRQRIRAIIVMNAWRMARLKVGCADLTGSPSTKSVITIQKNQRDKKEKPQFPLPFRIM